MAIDKRPGYLRPVPDSGDGSTAPKLDEGEAAANNGITAPVRRGHSGMFITDVIVELGYATRERVDEVINEARVAGKLPETMLRDYHVIDGEGVIVVGHTRWRAAKKLICC